MLVAWRTRACRSVMSSEIGITTSPIPTKSRIRSTYMRPEADRIWPQARRRARRRGAAGRQVAREIRIAASRAIPASKRPNASGLSTSWTSAFDPPPTAEQKKSVAPVPKALPPGTV